MQPTGNDHVKKLLGESSSPLQMTPIRHVGKAIADLRKEMSVVGSIMGEPDHPVFSEGLMAAIRAKAQLLDYEGVKAIFQAEEKAAGNQSPIITADQRADELFWALKLDTKQRPRAGGYGATQGEAGVLETIAAIEQKRFKTPIHTNNIMVCSGGNHGMFCTLSALAGKDRPIVVHEPCFPVYKDFAKTMHIPITAIDTSKTNFVLDAQELEHTVQQTNGGKCIAVINYPNNPTSKHPDESTLRAYAGVIERCRDAFFVDDAIYAGLAYNGRPVTISDFLSDEARERVITIRASTKEHSHADSRVGHVVASADVIRKMLPHAVYSSVHANRDAQIQYAADLNVFESRQPGIAAHYRDRISAIQGRLEKAGLIETGRAPEGGFFITLNLSAAKGKTLDNKAKKFLLTIGSEIPYADAAHATSAQNDYQAAALLATKVGVPTVPLSAFYVNNVEERAKDMRVRLTVTGEIEQLQEIATRLEAFQRWAQGQDTAQDRQLFSQVAKPPEKTAGR
jgi:aspartate/methionine/tyrosine aminotransferase